MGSKWGLRESYSLRAHLIAFAAVTLLPVLGLTGVLLARSAALEHQQLETELAHPRDDAVARKKRLGHVL
jgi:hypothetical protein